MVYCGSLFSGIGGFELGLSYAIPGLNVLWQVEQDSFCQKVLKKNYPAAQLFDDVCFVSADTLEPVDLLCAGFPCQDVSIAQNGKAKGIYDGEKSSLFWEVFRIACQLRPRIIVLENTPGLFVRGFSEVVGSLSSIGYDSEWCVVSARSQGAVHKRDRLFIVSYTNNFKRNTSHTNSKQCKEQPMHTFTMEKESRFKSRISDQNGVHKRNYWKEHTAESPFCRVDDGVSDRLAKLKALGNAIVPQCSEYVGKCILNSGLLDECY